MSPAELRATFQGETVSPGDPGYDEARRLWNGAIDRRPSLIVRCAGEEDAIAALAHARANSLPISVRGGGHNVGGWAVVNDGVVIDFSNLRQVDVDLEKKTARVQPGALWGDFDAATQAFGLSGPAGVVTHTGVAGLTLGGGFGWRSRTLGLTSDNLISARLVLANGTRITTSADHHPDLFWAIRGGGGNFGIVTEFEFALHETGTEVLAGPILHPMANARAVLRFYRDFIRDAPDELSVYLNLRSAPDLPWVPVELRGTPVVVLIPFYAGDLDEGERLLRPLREFGPPAADLLKRKPYVEQQAMFDATVPHHWSYYWKSHYLPPLTDAAIDVLVENAWTKKSPASYTIIFHLGGRISRLPDDHSAASGRDAAHAVNINGAWPEGGPDHPDINWCRGLFAALEPHATGGVYVNFMHNDEGEARVEASYGKRFDRLAGIKARYDPENLFRSNQNIPPRA